MRNLFRWRFVNFSILMDKISTFEIVKGLIMKLWFLDPAARWKCKERVRGEKRQLLSRGFKFETQKKVIEKTSSLGLEGKLLLFLRDWKICRFSRQQSTPFERGKKTLTRRRSPCLENWKEEGRNFIVFLSTPYYLKDTSVFFSVSLSPFFNTFVPVQKYWKIAKNVLFQILRNVFSKKSEIWNSLP